MVALTKHTPGSICWIDLMSPDVEKAKAFYGKLFGWSFSSAGPQSGGYLMIKQDGRDVGGLSGPTPGEEHHPGAPTMWNGYFSVEDLGAASQRIVELGGKVSVPPMPVMDLGQMLVAEDPTGASFRLWKKERFAGASVMMEPGTLLWSQCDSSAPERSVAFYEQLLGLTSRKLEDPPYWTLAAPPGRQQDGFGGVMQLGGDAPKRSGSYWIFYFSVEDVGASVELARALGGTVQTSATDTPFGTMAQVSDPLGTPFMLMKPRPPS